jgi:ribonucleoside-diphosphate reductase alpha chain
LKSIAIYREGSKRSAPLNTRKTRDMGGNGENEVALDVTLDREDFQKRILELEEELTTLRGKLDQPIRHRMSDTRMSLTHKFEIAGHEGYITVGLYEDGQPGELFIHMAKEGSTIGGLMDTIATLVSVALQYGVPVESLVRKFEHVRFEPSGMTRNSEIPIAKSLVDYIFRWLAMEFIEGYRAANAPKRPEKKKPAEAPAPAPAAAREGEAPSEPSSSSDLPNPRPQHKKEGNGHGPRIDPPDTHPFAYGDEPRPQAGAERSATPGDTSTGVNLRLQIVVDPLSQQGTEMQADAPACDVCGSITVRSGTCYKCLNCGNSMGCS